MSSFGNIIWGYFSFKNFYEGILECSVRIIIGDNVVDGIDLTRYLLARLHIKEFIGSKVWILEIDLE